MSDFVDKKKCGRSTIEIEFKRNKIETGLENILINSESFNMKTFNLKSKLQLIDFFAMFSWSDVDQIPITNPNVFSSLSPSALHNIIKSKSNSRKFITISIRLFEVTDTFTFGKGVHKIHIIE